MKYIQLIGTQRSGSNLLRLMLNQLDEICAPHPPHILSVFLPILSKYGNLEKSKGSKNQAGPLLILVDPTKNDSNVAK